MVQLRASTVEILAQDWSAEKTVRTPGRVIRA